ncbi:MAG: hypothetical protein JNM47_04120, partial [Hyphomonadaceae bacterium]|nr:hypothetical protein [Hyphomonadaceae bacterium]
MPVTRFTGTFSVSSWSATLPVEAVFTSLDAGGGSDAHNFRGVCGCAACMGKAVGGDTLATTIPGDSSTTEVLTLGTARNSAIDFVGD